MSPRSESRDFRKSAGSRRGETAGCGLRGFTTWYEGVAEKATRRESPLISVLHTSPPGTD